MLYAFNDENLAVSFDGGKSWRRKAEDLAYPPFCGINNDRLWLKHQELQVYVLRRLSTTAQERAAAKPDRASSPGEFHR